MDAKTRELIREARRLLAAYTGATGTVEIMGMDVSIAMARSSFVAHSIHRGYERSLVEQIAAHVWA